MKYLRRTPVREYHRGDERKKFYKAWRTRVYKRDRFTCRLCRESKTYLNAHHIQKKAWFPKKAYITSNGITLCKKCHSVVTHREEAFESLFQTLVKNKVTMPKTILTLLKEYKDIDKRWVSSIIKKLNGRQGVKL